MNAQAEQMKGIVDELVALVGGNGNGARSIQRVTDNRPPVTGHTKKLGTVRAIKGPGKRGKGMELAVHKATLHQAKEVSPEEVVPMHDVDFKDF